jgi:GT2 family glycosyltransferase
LPVYNGEEFLEQALDSILNQTFADFSLVVSDNASTDGSQQMVRERFPEVQLLDHPKEQGYARAASLGMAFLADRTKYIFSTTNDVIVDPDLLSVLVSYAEQHPKAGVLGTRIYFFDRPTVLWHAGGRIHPLHGHSSHIGWERQDHPRYAKVRACDFVTGCGFLLRSDVVKEIGFFNENLIFYSEDADLCYRVREKGFEVIYVPEAKMWHKVSTTLAKNRPLQLRYSTRNNLYLLQRHKVGFYPWSLLVNLLLVCPFKMAIFAAMFKGSNSVGIYRGIRDWQAGKLGWLPGS